MRSGSAVRIALLWLSCLGLLLPPSALAAAPGPPRAAAPAPARPALRIGDAALGPQGTLRGKVVDPQGTAIPGARVAVFTRVAVLKQDSAVADVTADGEGRFTVARLRPGTYLVVGGEGAGAFRVWPGPIAPPAAVGEVLIVSDGTVVRGQDGVYRWISEHFLLTSAMIAATIAVPVVLLGNQTHGPSSP